MYTILHIETALLHVSKKQQNSNVIYPTTSIYVSETNISPIFHMPEILNVHQEGGMPVNMQHMNSMVPTMWPEMLYINGDNNANTDIDSVAQIISWVGHWPNQLKANTLTYNIKYQMGVNSEETSLWRTHVIIGIISKLQNSRSLFLQPN